MIELKDEQVSELTPIVKNNEQTYIGKGIRFTYQVIPFTLENYDILVSNLDNVPPRLEQNAQTFFIETKNKLVEKVLKNVSFSVEFKLSKICSFYFLIKNRFYNSVNFRLYMIDSTSRNYPVVEQVKPKEGNKGKKSNDNRSGKNDYHQNQNAFGIANGGGRRNQNDVVPVRNSVPVSNGVRNSVPLRPIFENINFSDINIPALQSQLRNPETKQTFNRDYFISEHSNLIKQIQQKIKSSPYKKITLDSNGNFVLEDIESDDVIDENRFHQCDFHSSVNSMGPISENLMSKINGIFGYMTKNYTCYDCCYLLDTHVIDDDEIIQINDSSKIINLLLGNIDNNVNNFNNSIDDLELLENKKNIQSLLLKDLKDKITTTEATDTLNNDLKDFNIPFLNNKSQEIKNQELKIFDYVLLSSFFDNLDNVVNRLEKIEIVIEMINIETEIKYEFNLLNEAEILILLYKLPFIKRNIYKIGGTEVKIMHGDNSVRVKIPKDLKGDNSLRVKIPEDFDFTFKSSIDLNDLNDGTYEVSFIPNYNKNEYKFNIYNRGISIINSLPIGNGLKKFLLSKYNIVLNIGACYYSNYFTILESIIGNEEIGISVIGSKIVNELTFKSIALKNEFFDYLRILIENVIYNETILEVNINTNYNLFLTKKTIRNILNQNDNSLSISINEIGFTVNNLHYLMEKFYNPEYLLSNDIYKAYKNDRNQIFAYIILLFDDIDLQFKDNSSSFDLKLELKKQDYLWIDKKLVEKCPILKCKGKTSLLQIIKNTDYFDTTFFKLKNVVIQNLGKNFVKEIFFSGRDIPTRDNERDILIYLTGQIYAEMEDNYKFCQEKFFFFLDDNSNGNIKDYVLYSLLDQNFDEIINMDLVYPLIPLFIEQEPTYNYESNFDFLFLLPTTKAPEGLKKIFEQFGNTFFRIDDIFYDFDSIIENIGLSEYLSILSLIIKFEDVREFNELFNEQIKEAKKFFNQIIKRDEIDITGNSVRIRTNQILATFLANRKYQFSSYFETFKDIIKLLNDRSDKILKFALNNFGRFGTFKISQNNQISKIPIEMDINDNPWESMKRSIDDYIGVYYNKNDTTIENLNFNLKYAIYKRFSNDILYKTNKVFNQALNGIYYYLYSSYNRTHYMRYSNETDRYSKFFQTNELTSESKSKLATDLIAFNTEINSIKNLYKKRDEESNKLKLMEKEIILFKAKIESDRDQLMLNFIESVSMGGIIVKKYYNEKKSYDNRNNDLLNLINPMNFKIKNIEKNYEKINFRDIKIMLEIFKSNNDIYNLRKDIYINYYDENSLGSFNNIFITLGQYIIDLLNMDEEFRNRYLNNRLSSYGLNMNSGYGDLLRNKNEARNEFAKCKAVKNLINLIDRNVISIMNKSKKINNDKFYPPVKETIQNSENYGEELNSNLDSSKYSFDKFTSVSVKILKSNISKFLNAFQISLDVIDCGPGLHFLSDTIEAFLELYNYLLIELYNEPDDQLFIIFKKVSTKLFDFLNKINTPMIQIIDSVYLKYFVSIINGSLDEFSNFTENIYKFEELFNDYGIKYTTLNYEFVRGVLLSFIEVNNLKFFDLNIINNIFLKYCGSIDILSNRLVDLNHAIIPFINEYFDDNDNMLNDEDVIQYKGRYKLNTKSLFMAPIFSRLNISIKKFILDEDVIFKKAIHENYSKYIDKFFKKLNMASALEIYLLKR